MFIICNEELAPICVWLTAVGHGDHATLCMLQSISDLISEFAIGGGVYALATFASPCRITTLQAMLTLTQQATFVVVFSRRNFM